ncbi:MAG: glycosyltransferase [Fimbriimonadaceae bacterium]|nr:glycosyltransferase [Chitinophagales bacterium]
MNKFLISVIMPAFNAERYLSQSIQSVIDQTYENWELWVIDDASTDNSKIVIEEYKSANNRINSIYLEKNSGTAIARNSALKMSNGQYIAFLDADDVWKKNKLEVQVSLMQKNNYAFTFSMYEIINESGIIKNKIIKCPEKISYAQLLKNNTIGCLTAMYDVQILGKMYMPKIRKRQDYGLWLDILRTGTTGYGIPQSLAYYRETQTSLSANKLSVIKYNWQILRKHQQLNIFSSLYYFSFFLLHKTIKYFA